LKTDGARRRLADDLDELAIELELLVAVGRHLHSAEQVKQLDERLAHVAVARVGWQHERARLAIEHDGGHHRAHVAIVAGVRAAAVASTAEGGGRGGHVARARV